MNIVVNGRFLSRRVTGVERYGREILRRLPYRVRVVRPRPERQGASGHAWEQFILPGCIRPGEILWSPANTGPLAVANQALTLHDLTPLEHPGWFTPAFALWYRIFLPVLVRRVKHMVVSSEHVRRKILRRFSLQPERVTVIPGGVDFERFHPNQPPLNGLPPRYVLFLGSLQPRKNLVSLLSAWGQIFKRFPDLRLVVAGEENNRYRQVSFTRDVENVLYLGYVPEADLPALYAGALAYVIPSLEEGFGMTVLEAMACGTPVVAARAGALPEVVGEAGLFFDPVQVDELAGTLAACLQDSIWRADLTERGLQRVKAFSWRVSAERLWQVMECLVN